MVDPQAPAGDQTRFTDWQYLEFNVVPYPVVDATELVKNDAVQGESYPLTLDKSAAGGYTHPEFANATKVILTGIANINLTEGTEVNCNADGTCDLNLPPIATTFADIGEIVPAYDAANNGFGWAKFDYQVVTTISGVELISEKRTTKILYRAVPTPENPGAAADYFVAGYQGEDIFVSLAPNDATAPANTPSVCSKDNANDVYCGYEYGDKTKAATDIQIFAADADLIPPLSLDSELENVTRRQKFVK